MWAVLVLNLQCTPSPLVIPVQSVQSDKWFLYKVFFVCVSRVLLQPTKVPPKRYESNCVLFINILYFPYFFNLLSFFLVIYTIFLHYLLTINIVATTKKSTSGLGNIPKSHLRKCGHFLCLLFYFYYSKHGYSTRSLYPCLFSYTTTL